MFRPRLHLIIKTQSVSEKKFKYKQLETRRHGATTSVFRPFKRSTEGNRISVLTKSHKSRRFIRRQQPGNQHPAFSDALLQKLVA